MDCWNWLVRIGFLLLSLGGAPTLGAQTAVQVDHQWQPLTQQRVPVWQGFNHEWRRFVVLPEAGRVPNRISLLENFVAPAQEGDGFHFTFAQATGVDGNYMWPQGRVAWLRSQPDWQLRQGQVRLDFTDAIEEAANLSAESDIEVTLELPIVVDDELVSEPLIALQGFALTTACDDAEQPAEHPCNSQGMWPYEFELALGECRIDIPSQMALCPLRVHISRGWTANKGGLDLSPLFKMIKPLNRVMQLELTVHYLWLWDRGANMPTSEVIHYGRAHQLLEKDQPAQTLQTPLPGAQSLPLIKSLAFRLEPPEQVASLWRWLRTQPDYRGRYLAQLQFEMIADQQGDSVDLVQRLWSPITVVDSDAYAELGVQWIGLDQPIVRRRVMGQICNNSTEEAPWITSWKLCDWQGAWARDIWGGQERLRHSVPINSPD